MQKKIFQTIIFIIFWDSLMFYQMFLSPQVKRCAIVTYEYGIYELLNDFGLPAKVKFLLILAKKLPEIAIKPFL